MATLDLTLDSFEVPALSEYIPPFGHKKQEGGLSTREVNNNIMMPFLSMRPTIVTENSVTTRIEYDAKLVFFANLQNAVNLDLEKASYIGCEILIYNLSAHACTVNKNTWNYTVPAGGYIKLKWNGSAWSKGVSSAVQAAIRDAVADRYSTTETMTNKTWIDGKRIYRRVWTGTYNEGRYTDILPEGLIMISITGYIKYPQDSGTRYWVINAPQNTAANTYFASVWYNSTGYVQFEVQGPFAGDDSVIIFEYTKATD